MKAVGSLFVTLTCLFVFGTQMFAQQANSSTPNPLITLLQSKGILSSAEAAEVSQASSPDEGNRKLAQLLVEKGLISDQEYQTTFANSVTPVNQGSRVANFMNAVFHPQTQNPQKATTTAPAPSEPSVIPAVAPLRVLPIDIPKQGGLIPDLSLGSGARMKFYGFFKASAVSDTASSGGATFGSNDWPLPLLVGGDTGPTSDPQFHIKARSFRIGSQFEWVPKNSNITLTGRVEGDFEGDYTDVNNRNISGVRSSQFGLRVAWMRLDTKIGGLPWFAQFGQDWLLVSSTLPNLFETTGLGIGMGTLWERSPMFKTGVQFHSGDFKVQPEFAIVLPVGGNSTLTADQRLRFGDRSGAESNQPGLEGRVVFQFPLSHSWKGVAPAQIIFSGHHARVNEIIPHAAQTATSFTCVTTPCTIPTPLTNLNTPNVGFNTLVAITGASNCGEASGTCNLEQIFPKGIQAGNPQNVWTAEIQLPTPWVTFDAKYYRGDDLRFFFAGQLNDVYSRLGPLVEAPENLLTGISFSGRSILFGCASGTPGGTTSAPTLTCPGTPISAATLQPVGGSGGFMELSFPLSRIFHANPEGRNSGWVLHTTYSTDRANYADSTHANHLGRTDLDTVSLTYRLNKWVSFIQESSYIVTRTANNHEPSGAITFEYLPFAGGKTRQAHNWRNEFGPVFTF